MSDGLFVVIGADREGPRTSLRNRLRRLYAWLVPGPDFKHLNRLGARRSEVTVSDSRANRIGVAPPMLAGKIYLKSDNGLVAMHEAVYDAEELLQRLVADYPDLLAGDQMRPTAPRRWLLIEREAGIADTVGGLV